MDIIECQKIITKYYKIPQCKYHSSDKQLVVNNKKYSIRPDEYFLFDNIIVVEYENTKRPVESISKYWWLFHKTDWLSNNIEMSLIFISVYPKANRIRKESILILGKELESKFSNKLKFYFVYSIQLNQVPLNKLLPNPPLNRTA